MPTMLYKYPGSHEIHGDHFDYTIVEDDQIEATLADGWKLTTPEAKQAHLDKLAAKDVPDDTTPATRAELEQKAGELGIKFDGRTSDRKLSELIKAAIEPGSPASDAQVQQ